jgi:hypothetical protein
MTQHQEIGISMFHFLDQYINQCFIFKNQKIYFSFSQPQKNGKILPSFFFLFFFFFSSISSTDFLGEKKSQNYLLKLF